MMEHAINRVGRLIIKLYASKMNSSLKDVPSEQVDNWFNDRTFFFVLALGRSGSMFLANLLNEANDNQVLHEPTRLDFLAYSQAYYGMETDYNYISEYRKKFIYHQNNEQRFSQYGEVNSLLRRHAQNIDQDIPNVTFFHLVRDGRDVVRSMMSRRTFTYWDPISQAIHPRHGDDYSESWLTMDRFERLCWYWWNENKYLEETIGKPIFFEKLINNYGYFKDSLLDPLDIHISQDSWMDRINQPKNTTTQHVLPHWEKWEPDMKKQFEKICGSLMEKLGYYES